MPEAIRKVNVIGHLHPDTDSICSAIAYAYLKNQISDIEFEPRRAGAINRETAFALKSFGFDEPELITSVAPQIKDIQISRQQGISRETSLITAWNLMRDLKTGTLIITDEDNDLEGLITVRDIANANMDIFDSEVLSSSRTHLSNIVSTLQGELVSGNPDGVVTTGKIRVGTTPEMMEGFVEKGDVVLVTNRYETQRFAVEAGASCLIICNGAGVSSIVVEAAREKGCTVITTPYDTYAAARLISMAIPVRAKMLGKENVLHFSVNTSVDDAQKVMASSQHRFFPVMDEDGKYIGVVSSPDMLNVNKKHVILVDHNERSQAVDGLERAEIMEIIDHHRIGSIETSAPAYFRNMPVGCTATIIYGLFEENGVDIPKNIAGIMLSAILSDTLAFRSPTCTPRDKIVGEKLAEIAGVNVDEYADAMFDAGADLTGRTADEVFNSDFKVFSRGHARFGVGQASFMTENSRKAAEALVGPYLKDAAAANDIPMVFYMFTDVKSQTTEMMYWGENTEQIVSRTFNVTPESDIATLPGVVSRKKQVIPPLMATLQDMDEG
ncbi:putative manganese-dependent inorganic diphosphatase [Parafannyhessea umbonata]|uniref:inorganic diphosphatase n=1 Tax=Parafannyhessea umbonata TaxID=604330 RepID=A0A1H9PJC7_9ACTN|nr:putative manganese-dependent inorganic diphosphatase [Parafannyhessea umbonata]SER47663.1 manganese-dependent inorganic pyrophosphatase [Parafannyhessea umbonata]